MKVSFKSLLPYLFVTLPLGLLFFFMGGFSALYAANTGVSYIMTSLLLLLLVQLFTTLLWQLMAKPTPLVVHFITLVFIAIWTPLLFNLETDYLNNLNFGNTRNDPIFKLFFLLSFPVLYSMQTLVYESLYGKKKVPYGADIFAVTTVVFLGILLVGLSESGLARLSNWDTLLSIGMGLGLMILIWTLMRFGNFLLGRTYESSLFRFHYVRLFFGLIAPIAGLLVHTEIQIFGNLNAPFIWVIAVVNGICIWLPIQEDRKFQWLHFSLLIVGIPYIIYFVVLLLPWVPLAIPLILYFGLGIAMLTPMILLIMQLRHIKELYSRLGGKQIMTQALAIGGVSLLVIPSYIDINFRRDAGAIEQAMVHIIAPDFDTEQPLPTTSSLQRALNNASRWHTQNRSFFSTNATPLLSEWYRKRATGGWQMSRQIENELRWLFLNEEKPRRTHLQTETPNCCALEKVTTTSKFDTTMGVWVSHIDLELLQNNHWHDEYKTSFVLPDGAYITDYYLDVFGERKSGLLTERYAAQWIYEKIRNTKRDPGLLFYESDNHVVLRVFPFAKGELRKTGFEITHAEPFSLRLGNEILELGNSNTAKTSQSFENETLAFVPGQTKQTLPTTHRIPYFHVLLDYSLPQEQEKGTENQERFEFFQQQLDTLQQKYPNVAIRVTAVNHNPQNSVSYSQWKDAPSVTALSGAAYWERALQKALHENYFSHKAERPVFMILSHSELVVVPHLTNWEFTAPDGGQVFVKSAFSDWQNRMIFRSSKRAQTLENALKITPIKSYKSTEGINYYLTDDTTNGSLVIKTPYPEPKELIGNSWQVGLQLQAWSRAAALSPSYGDIHWLDQLKENLQNRVLSSLTAFIVVETADQEQELLSRQKELIANGRKNQSTDTFLGMSASGMDKLFYMIFVLFSVWLFKQNRS